MKKIYIFVLFVFAFVHLMAQVTGRIVDMNGKPAKGAYVFVLGDPTRQAVVDENGAFSLHASEDEVIEVVCSNRSKQQFVVKGHEQLFTLDGKNKNISLGIGSKTEQSVTQAVSAVFAEDLEAYNSNSPYQLMYGTLSGLTALQDLGWNPSARLFVRGAATLSSKAPLIVVDGFPRKIEMLSGLEIESITVLKDGAATALWGAQGANGVIVITTKRGTYKSMKTSVDYKYGMGFTYDMPEFVDAPTYARAMNEASINDGLSPRYSDVEIQNYGNGIYNDLYPNVDWLNSGLRDYTTNHKLGITFSGGGEKIRYFTALDYQNDMGLLRHTDFDDRFSTQMRKNKLSLRVNLDVDLTQSTKVQLNIQGVIRENQRPTGAEEDVIGALYQVPSLSFPIRTLSGAWGSNDVFKSNPIARIADSGYYKNNRRQLQADLRLHQELSMWVKGLSAEVSIAWDNMATYEESQKKDFLYEINIPTIDAVTGEILSVASKQYGENSALSYSSKLASQYMFSAVETKLGYSRNWGSHFLDAAVLYRQESMTPSGRNASRRYQSVMATAGYHYMNKYFVDVVANNYGSSVLLKNDRFRTYPAVSAAWILSNEKFMNCDFINLLKLRASWGLSGYADFSYELDKQYYVEGNGYFFGNANAAAPGFREGALPLSYLTNETAHKYNVGLDMRFLNKIDFTLDFYSEKRTDILLPSAPLFSSVIGIAAPRQTAGVVKAKGMDASLMWKDEVGEIKYHVGGTFSFARSKIIENNEGPQLPYLSRKGDRLGQFYGLEADGLFSDWEEIKSSPQQKFSSVRPGDVKYRDQNDDDIIDQNDFVAIGYSTVMPEIYYGLNVGFEWKGLGCNLQFQGVNNFSTILNTKGLYQPLSNNTNLSTWYMEDHVRWTEATKAQATLPRLTTQDNENNFQNSSLWLRDASYFKLRNAYLYYRLPKAWIQKLGLSEAQLYTQGENLFSVDKIKYSNSENVGVLYPDMRQVSVGMNIKF